MAADYIVVDRGKPLGSTLIRAANNLAAVREQIAELLAVASHCNDGSDFTLMESQFGLQAGTGGNVTTLIGLVDTILNQTGTVTGGNRLAQLDEFVSRISGQ